ncbi:enhanced serine sensitivity protein SseB [Caldifermentibacillus hisashii]|uniref:Enhanced serine sensitivity protein SseB n=1 Tax=Caldifermentibacillus hisashii TaxID=996558 RepID=A0ABU9K2C3_9BACI
MVDVNKPVTNPELVKRIEILMKDYSLYNERLFLDELMKANFLAPVSIEPDIKGGGKTVLKQDTKINFFGITNSANQNFLPAFTDWDELRKWNNQENTQTLILTFKDYEAMIGNAAVDTWAGFVINPYSQNIIMDRDKIRMTRNHTIETMRDKQVLIGLPKRYPEKLVEALKEVLPNMKGVECAYLLLMVRNKSDASYLIVADIDDEPRKRFAEIAEVATQYLLPNEKIDFVPLKSEFGRNATKGYTPFYKRIIRHNRNIDL